MYLCSKLGWKRSLPPFEIDRRTIFRCCAIFARDCSCVCVTALADICSSIECLFPFVSLSFSHIRRGKIGRLLLSVVSDGQHEHKREGKQWKCDHLAVRWTWTWKDGVANVTGFHDFPLEAHRTHYAGTYSNIDNTKP